MLPTLKNGSGNKTDDDSGPSSNLFDPHSYRSVHNLATNTDKRGFEDLMKKAAEAIFLARCLKFNGFFGHGEEDDTEETRKAEVFISSLLLRHLQIASTNGLEMAECLLKNNDVTKFDIIPVGGAIFPTMSFFNHSCYPNALRLGYQGFQVNTLKKSQKIKVNKIRRRSFESFEPFAKAMKLTLITASISTATARRCDKNVQQLNIISPVSAPLVLTTGQFTTRWSASPDLGKLQ